MRPAAALLLLALAWTAPGCGRPDRQTDEQLRSTIAALERERDTLRARLEALAGSDPSAEGMPEASVRIGVPAAVASALIERVATGVVNQVTLQLENLRVRKRGQVRKVVTLGDYDLRVTIDRLTARLETDTPEVTFGGNRVAVSLPVGVVSGTGRATVRFKWDGRTIGGALCGDQNITQVVTGGVRPDRYTVSGALALSATPAQILATPVFPRLRVRLHVKPSEASWAAARKVLDDKSGVCGFVLDRVNVMGHLQQVIDKGFAVRIPTERLRPLALPVGVYPSMTIRGRPVALGIRVSNLAITEQMIWLGAEVGVGLSAARAK